MSTRIGPRMQEVTDFIAGTPGCSQRRAALSLIYHGGRSNQHGRNVVQRALRAGMIENRGTESRFALYAVDA